MLLPVDAVRSCSLYFFIEDGFLLGIKALLVMSIEAVLLLFFANSFY